VFIRIGWAATWLFAPLAGLAALGVAIFTTLTGYDELAPAAAMAVCAVVMWLLLIWAVARLLSGRTRGVYLGGCATLAVGALAASYIPSAGDDVDDVSVSQVLPGKPR
jgi:high-affinity Fe2+/Pb2+ permease